jgi:hypothetical protein
MNFIRTIIKHIICNSKELPKPKPLGRWRMEHCNKKTNCKIDLSNEDHCGPCGQYMLEKLHVMDLQKEKHNESTK